MELAPAEAETGWLVPARQLPADEFLAHLSALVADERALDQLALALPEPRLGTETWRGLLAHELRILLRWSAVRLLEAGLDQARASPDRVLVLLPRYGLGLHLLRRAIPFAALGCSVACAAPAGIALAPALGPLCERLGVPPPSVLPAEVTGILEALTQRDLVVLTGRRASYRAVVARTHGLVRGATGRCAVILVSDCSAFGVAEARRLSRTIRPSCTQIRAVLRVPRAKIGASTEPSRLSADLRRLHPSVVYVHPDLGPPPPTIAGYRAAAFAAPVTTGGVGFGRDPYAGWPGDYRV